MPKLIIFLIAVPARTDTIGERQAVDGSCLTSFLSFATIALVNPTALSTSVGMAVFLHNYGE